MMKKKKPVKQALPRTSKAMILFCRKTRALFKTRAGLRAVSASFLL
jgi:hypothetical protein